MDNERPERHRIYGVGSAGDEGPGARMPGSKFTARENFAHAILVVLTLYLSPEERVEMCSRALKLKGPEWDEMINHYYTLPGSQLQLVGPEKRSQEAIDYLVELARVSIYKED